MSRYQFIEQVATTEPVQVLCRALHVRPAGYYQGPGRADQPTPAWELAATAAFSRHVQPSRTHRLWAELHTVGHYTWRRRGLRVPSTRPPRPRITVADPAAVVAENLLPEPTRAQSGVSERYHLLASSRRALMLSGYLARYLLAARGGLAPRPADTHQASAPAPGIGTDATPAGFRPGHPCRPR